MSANVIATCFALIGFAAAVVVGWAAGNPNMTIVTRSLGAFFICLIVGRVVGHIAQHVVDQNIEAYKLANPIPPDPLRAEAAASEAPSNETVEALQESKPATSRSAA